MRSSRVRRASKPPLFRQRGFVRVGTADTLQVGPASLWEDDGISFRSRKTIDFSETILYNQDTNLCTGAQSDEHSGKHLITEYRREAWGGSISSGLPRRSRVTFGSWGPQDAVTDGSCFAADFLRPFSAAGITQEDFTTNHRIKENND